MYVVGARGLGKSTMLINMLLNKNMLSKRFHQIYIISPTAILDSKFDILRDSEITIPNKKLIALLKKLNKKKDIFEPIPHNEHIENSALPIEFKEEIDLDFLKDIIEEQKYVVSSFGKQYADKILFIFDDMIGSKIFDSRPFKQFIYRSRHYEISNIVLSQSYYAFPKTLRLNISELILFEISNIRELKDIYNENNSGLEEKEFLELYKGIMEESFSFLTINFFNPKKYRLYKNFSTPLIL